MIFTKHLNLPGQNSTIPDYEKNYPVCNINPVNLGHPVKKFRTMKKIIPFATVITALLNSCSPSSQNIEKQKVKAERPAYAIAIHGGAGTIRREDMSPEKEAAYRTALDSALTIGETILKNGGTALDAVELTITWLEDCPLFNAGRGPCSPTTAKTNWTRVLWTAPRKTQAPWGRSPR